jgi:HK97 family phage major capsid protein
MSFTIPRQLVAPTVATVAEAGATSETGLTSDYITVSVVKKSGRNVVSFELADRSAPAFMPILEDQLRKAHAKDKEAYVVSQLTAGGTAAGTTAGTLTGFQNFVSTESVAAGAALGGEFADQLVTNGSWWTEFIKAQDTTGRPLFPEVGAMNAPGVANGQSDRGVIYGANLYVSPNVTSGLVDESAFLINRDSVALWESPVNRVQVIQTGTGEIEVMVYNYVAVQVLRAGGIRRFNIT